MNTREEQIEIANEIQRQLGGARFRVMTGAKDMHALDDTTGPGLSFRIPGTTTKNHITHIRVKLDPSDTYTMEFWAYRKQRIPGPPPMKKIAEHDMIYDDMLQDIFTEETGLYTHI
jgi:hypothetical protein